MQKSGNLASKIHFFLEFTKKLGNDISVNTLPFVIQSEAKNLGNIMAGVNVNVHEILPPFGRLNDKLCQEVYRYQKLRKDR